MIERVLPTFIAANGRTSDFRAAVVRDTGTQRQQGKTTSQETKLTKLLHIKARSNLARAVELLNTLFPSWRRYDERFSRLFSISDPADDDGRGVERDD